MSRLRLQEYRVGTENMVASDNVPRKYINAVSTATKDIVSASNLVNRIPGLEKKVSTEGFQLKDRFLTEIDKTVSEQCVSGYCSWDREILWSYCFASLH